MDYLDNNRLIAHYCGFNIMEPLPSYWTYDRFLRQLNNGALKSIMADLVRKLYELGVVDASFIGAVDKVSQRSPRYVIMRKTT